MKVGAESAIPRRSAKAFHVFENKPQQAGLQYHQLLGRGENLGGFAVVETDDPATLVTGAGFSSRILGIP